jgi:hypothetical protein
MNIFDIVSVGILAAYIGGYIWVKASDHFAPPMDDE